MSGSRICLAPGVWVAAAALRWTASRSGGPGGQNVNKVNTRATLGVGWDELAGAMPADAIERLRAAVPRWVTAEGLQISSDEHRSLSGNRRACRERLEAAVAAAMQRPKLRRATRPTRGSQRRRLEAKRQRGERKAGRRPPSGE